MSAKLDGDATANDRDNAANRVRISRTRRRLVARVLVAAVAILLGWELIGYVVNIDASLTEWLLPVAAAFVVQATILGWRLWHGGTAGILTVLSIVGPSIMLALISVRSPRADVIYFLGSLIGFAAGQFAVPLEFPAHGRKSAA